MSDPIKVHLPDGPMSLIGQYANHGIVSCIQGSAEFYLDFLHKVPNLEDALLVARIQMSPCGAKALAIALANQVREYEAQHETIGESQAPEVIYGEGN
jgi:hypothetical protein